VQPAGQAAARKGARGGPTAGPLHVSPRRQANQTMEVLPSTLFLNNLPHGAGHSWMETLCSSFGGITSVVKATYHNYGFAEFLTAADAEAARKHLSFAGKGYPYPKFNGWDKSKTTPTVQFARKSRQLREPEPLLPGAPSDLPSLLSSDGVSPRPDSCASRDSADGARGAGQGRVADLRSLLSGDRVSPRPDSSVCAVRARVPRGVDPGCSAGSSLERGRDMDETRDRIRDKDRESDRSRERGRGSDRDRSRECSRERSRERRLEPSHERAQGALRATAGASPPGQHGDTGALQVVVPMQYTVDAAGQIIGKGGSFIKAINELSGCRIKLTSRPAKRADQVQYAQFIGTQLQVDLALELVNGRLACHNQADFDVQACADAFAERMHTPPAQHNQAKTREQSFSLLPQPLARAADAPLEVSEVVFKGYRAASMPKVYSPRGRMINSICCASLCDVNMGYKPPTGEKLQHVQFTGTRAQINLAMQMIGEVIAQGRLSTAAERERQHLIDSLAASPASAALGLIHPGGQSGKRRAPASLLARGPRGAADGGGGKRARAGHAGGGFGGGGGGFDGYSGGCSGGLGGDSGSGGGSGRGEVGTGETPLVISAREGSREHLMHEVLSSLSSLHQRDDSGSRANVMWPTGQLPSSFPSSQEYVRLWRPLLLLEMQEELANPEDLGGGQDLGGGHGRTMTMTRVTATNKPRPICLLPPPGMAEPTAAAPQNGSVAPPRGRECSQHCLWLNDSGAALDNSMWSLSHRSVACPSS